jgi:endonuclease
MPVKRFLVAIPGNDGSVELHPMKEWLRQHTDAVPQGLDATLSNSHQLRRGLRAMGWATHESDTQVRLIRPSDVGQEGLIEDILGPANPWLDDSEPDPVVEQSFGLEYQLRDFLAQNLASREVNGKRLRLYVDPAGRDGVEYPTAVGPIDILAVDHEGHFTVFELKRARTADRAVGQLARYMGWVRHTIGRDKDVHGIIVAKAIDENLRYAASVIPGVSLFEYQVEFHLRAASELPPSTPAN